MTIFKRGQSLLLAALVALPAMVADAAPQEAGRTRGNQPNPASADQARVNELRIAIQDMRTKEDLGYVQPGEVLSLEVGDRVRLRMVAVVDGRWKAPRYPSTAFGVLAGKDSIRVYDVNREQGSAVLEAVRASGDRDALVSYELLDQMNIRGGLVEGTITVRVGGDASPAPAPVNPAPAPAMSAEQRARSVVGALYRGILLREADDAGARPRVDRIVGGGYAEVYEIALEIAQSQESRSNVQSKASAEERLEALYRHLVGKSRSQIDPVIWDADLARVRSGQLDVVVRRLTSSPEFRVYQGFQRG